MKVAAWMVVVALLLSAGTTVVLAQQGAGPGPGPGGPGPGMRGGMPQEVTPEQFPEFKAQALKNIDERIKRMGEHRACVDKAQSHAEMRKCRPEPMMGGQVHRGQRPPQPPQAGGQGQQ